MSRLAKLVPLRRHAGRASERGGARRRHAGRIPAAARPGMAHAALASISTAGICAATSATPGAGSAAREAAHRLLQPDRSNSLDSAVHRRPRRRRQDPLAAHRRHRRLHLAPLKYTGTVGHVRATSPPRSPPPASLFNGYLDLGTWYGVTPYIGAGAGVAYMRVSDYSSTVAPPFTSSSSDQWNFTYAVMAGLAAAGDA